MINKISLAKTSLATGTATVYYTNYFDADIPVDIALFLAEYDPPNITYYIPEIVFWDNVTLPMLSSGQIGPTTFTWPDFAPGIYYYVWGIIADNYDPATGDITGKYDDLLKEAEIVITGIELTDFSLA